MNRMEQNHTKTQNLLKIQTEALRVASFMHRVLFEWYAQYGRVDLPWRNLKGENASYGVYISEIMLQQTQVSRVLGLYYTPFMKTFPTLQSLALAHDEVVLKMWEGLGYYSRARNLHKSAKICLEYYGGKLPNEYDKLASLPGIGSYSAGAILCFGFRQSVGFVDGNIRRVFSRLFAISKPKQSELEMYASLLVDIKNSFEYNQALLDVGAMLCTPRSPLCKQCPLESICKGKHNPHLYPLPKSKPLNKLTLHLALCVDSQSRIGVIKSNQALYFGLYNLPTLSEHYAKKYGQYVGECKHHYTTYAIKAKLWMMPYALQDEWIESDSENPSQNNREFLTLEELRAKPLSSLCKKALKLSSLT